MRHGPSVRQGLGQRSFAGIMNTERREYRGSSARIAGNEPPAARRGQEAKAREERTSGARILGQQAWASITRSLNLSTRELQLVRGVFEDATDFAIAASLRISPHTVHTHFERLHHKLGVDNRAQLILRVVNEFLKLTASPGSILPPVCPWRCDPRCPRRRGQAPV
jgi:DNA-binding CsgD family transcriptional regulator